MFKADLKARLERVFGIPRVTFLAPNPEAPEQDVLFVEISDVAPRMQASGGGRATAKVSGALVLFSQAERLTYGFFAKRIEQAAPADVRTLIFGREVDLANSPARIQNIHERRVPFTFLFDSQYDPDRGSITDLEETLTFLEE